MERGKKGSEKREEMSIERKRIQMRREKSGGREEKMGDMRKGCVLLPLLLAETEILG